MIIFIIILIIIALIFIKLRYWNCHKLRKEYKRLGVVTVGARGKGKDVTHALASYKTEHFANIEYHKTTLDLNLNDLTLSATAKGKDGKEIQLTPKMFIDDSYKGFNWQKKGFEGKNVFISDGGIYFASWLDNDLKKQYPSLPISYALWRHLYNSGLHVNTQVFSRLWLVLREQAEFVVSCQRCLNIPFFVPFLHKYMFLTVRTYTRYEDCEAGLKPLKPPLFGRKGKGSPITVANSARGDIAEYSVLVPKKWLMYDSRAFHAKVFKVPAPKKVKVKRKKIKPAKD